MEEKRKPNLKTILYIVILVAVIALAIITACISNAKRSERDDWKDKNDQIPEVTASIIN